MNNGKPAKTKNNPKKRHHNIYSGYYSYKNYQIGISKYKIVSLIFPKENFKIQKRNDNLSYPLQVFKDKKTAKQIKQLYKY
jgi:hypothetical protein